MAIAKVRLVTCLHSQFRFLLCCSSWLKTLLAQCTSHASSSLSTQTEIWIFQLHVSTYFRYHVTEYCAVIGTHSTVRGTKLLYGHVPDPFPWYRIGSGHTRLDWLLDIGFIHITCTRSFNWVWMEFRSQLTAVCMGGTVYGVRNTIFRQEVAVRWN